MGRVQRLPFLIGGSMSLIAGMISYALGSENRTIFIRMAVVMVIFYVIGVYVRFTIKSVDEEIRNKKEEELRRLLEAEKQKKAQKVDLVADDSADGFSPFGQTDNNSYLFNKDELTKAVSSVMKEQD